MSTFEFNKVYVIESLDSAIEKQTGKELYDDFFRWKEMEFNNDFKAELMQVKNKLEFHESLSKIKDNCIKFNHYPILHLEIHGSKEKTGLILQSGELIKWIELYDILTGINSITGNNLFLTLAVCHGGYVMELIKLSNPAPFWGFIGSFDTIYSSDLLIRYNEFYKEFLSSFNVNLAFKKLQVANSTIPSTYRFINSEQTFKEVYNKYLKENTSEGGIEKRKVQVREDEKLSFVNRRGRKKFEKEFAMVIRKTRNEYYRKHSEIFFMLKEFPENRKRFDVKPNLKNA